MRVGLAPPGGIEAPPQPSPRRLARPNPLWLVNKTRFNRVPIGKLLAPHGTIEAHCQGPSHGRKALTLLALVLLLASSPAHGATRRAPPKPAAPPPGPEIRRGADAAFGCQISNSERPMDTAAYLQCVQGQQRANRQQMGRGFEAFDTGLWYTARVRLRGLDAVVPSGLAKSNLDTASAGLAVAQQASGVTDGDVWRALHPMPGFERPADAGQPRHRRGHLGPANRDEPGGSRQDRTGGTPSR